MQSANCASAHAATCYSRHWHSPHSI
uniref:Uncharacterized protein n=1 Tax=Anguilla anguilla TaxID=7936 RepID=A0A0E9TNW8_ANGAN